MKPSFFEPFDEAALLAYVEGELGPEDAGRLRAVLRDHPEVLATLERLRSDRTELRSLPKPQLPRDLMEQLEPVLARPMLVEARPGSYRRRYHRRRRQRRLVAVGALAAAVLVLVAGGSLLSWSGWLGGVPGGPSEQRVAIDLPTALPAATAPPDGSSTETWPPEGAIVHHDLPTLPDAAPPRVASREPETRSTTTGARPMSPLPFVLVVRAKDRASVEDEIVARVAGMGGSMALVRNFSFDEARRIETELDVHRRGGSPAVEDPVVADVGSGPAGPAASWGADREEELIGRILEQFGAEALDRRGAGAPRSARLIGPVALAAPDRQQLLYSGQGASHTVTVPVARLAELLRLLHEAPGTETSLCWLPRDVRDPAELAWDEPPALPGPEAAVRHRDRIVRHLELLQADDPNAVVLLPVAVSSGP